MEHKILENGLWGEEVSKALKGVGIRKQLEHETPGTSRETSLESMQELIRALAVEEESGRRFFMHTGSEGRRIFNEAVREELTTSSVPNPVETYSMELLDLGVLEPPNIQRQGRISTRDIDYQRLQRGTITPVEYLDLISAEE